MLDGAGSYFEKKAYRVNQESPVWMLDNEEYTPPDRGFYLTEAITDNAISFIKTAEEGDQPFFLYLAYTAPHWSLHALPEDLRMAVYAAMIDRLDQNIGRVVNYLTEFGKIKNTLIIFLADNGGCHEPIKNRGNYLPTSAETGTRDSFDSYEYPWANVSNTPFRMFKHWVNEGGIYTPFIAHYTELIRGGHI